MDKNARGQMISRLWCTFDIPQQNWFPRAQRAEIGAEGAKMNNNARRARIFALISMKLGTRDV